METGSETIFFMSRKIIDLRNTPSYIKLCIIHYPRHMINSEKNKSFTMTHLHPFHDKEYYVCGCGCWEVRVKEHPDLRLIVPTVNSLSNTLMDERCVDVLPTNRVMPV